MLFTYNDYLLKTEAQNDDDLPKEVQERISNAQQSLMAMARLFL